MRVKPPLAATVPVLWFSVIQLPPVSVAAAKATMLSISVANDKAIDAGAIGTGNATETRDGIGVRLCAAAPPAQRVRQTASRDCCGRTQQVIN